MNKISKEKIVIIANGSLKNIKKAKRIASDADFIICADGGASYCLDLGITPNLLIGDFDSVPKKIRKKFAKHHVKIKRYPVHKDETDLELALHYAVQYARKGKKGSTVHLLAVLGGRWDMSIATLFLPASSRYHNLTMIIHSDNERIQLLYSGRHTITGKKGQCISFVPFCEDVKGLTLAGFKYPTNDTTLEFGSSRGVSNFFVEESCVVRFAKGRLLMVLEEE